MSLDLLKERFGHSVKKQADNKEKINEKLNEKFNSNSMDDLKSLKYQHQEDLEEKERIIENLEIEASKLANQVLNLEKEKSTILGELNNSKWMEDTVASKTKKIYEDKIRTMSIVDSSKLIPILIEVSRKKQGNELLNWGNWLKIPENIYLFQINEDMAKKVFQDTTALIKRYISNINLPTQRRELIEAGRMSRTRGGDEPTTTEYTNTYSLAFTGTSTDGGNSEYVSTNFNPDTYELWNGFTVSYWVKPNQLGTHMFALGKKGISPTERFTFGINTGTNAYVGIGHNKNTGIAHGMSVGTWYHWAFTYDGNSNGKGFAMYRDGVKLTTTNTSTWSNTGGFSGGIYLNGRNLEVGDGNSSYNNGWDCNLDEVAIFDEVKDVSTLYNSGTPSDLSSESGLVGYWRFEEGEGTKVKDLSGEGNHGVFGRVSGDTTALPTWTTDVPE